MVDNDELKAKIAVELKKLDLTDEQEELLVKELNYLSNLLIDIYEQNKDDRQTEPN